MMEPGRVHQNMGITRVHFLPYPLLTDDTGHQYVYVVTSEFRSLVPNTYRRSRPLVSYTGTYA